MLQALIQGVCLQAPDIPVSQTCVLQLPRRTGKGGIASTDLFYQEGSVGHLYGHQFCRFHSLACLPQPADTDSQNL